MPHLKPGRRRSSPTSPTSTPTARGMSPPSNLGHVQGSYRRVPKFVPVTSANRCVSQQMTVERARATGGAREAWCVLPKPKSQLASRD